MSKCSKPSVVKVSDRTRQNLRRIVELFNTHNPGMKIQDEAEAIAVAAELYLDQLIGRYLKGSSFAAGRPDPVVEYEPEFDPNGFDAPARQRSL